MMQVFGERVQVIGRMLRIAHLESDNYESVEDPQAMIDGLRKSGIKSDLFTFMQIMPDILPKYHFAMEWDNLAVIQVSTFDHWWNAQIRSEARNRARQAEKKGVTLKEISLDDALINGIWKIYNECPVRQERPFPHYGKDVEMVRKMSATFLETSVFIGAFLADELIGFVRLVMDKRRKHGNIMSILALAKHRDKAPMNALIAQTVRYCSERGIKYLAYQKFSYRNKGEDGLTTFKRINGFQRIDLPRYYVPLTVVGRVALRLGLCHGVLEYVPGPIVGKLRNLRNAWYKWKYQSANHPS